MRKFKLLKDLPWVKAGAIFSEHIALINFYSSIEGIYSVHINTIIENPDWFEEIKEEPKKKVRRWLWQYRKERELINRYGYQLLKLWELDGYFMTEDEAEKYFTCEYTKAKLNGQEVWQDFDD